MNIETRRTCLRTFLPEDLDDLHEYTSQSEVGEVAGWKTHTSINESLHTLRLYLKNPNVAAIVSKETGIVIGHIAVYEDSQNKREDTRELGFALNRDYQGQGIMDEVLGAVVDELVSNDVRQIYACCKKENEPAQKLLTACGFEKEGEKELFSKTLKKSFTSCEYVYRTERERDQSVKAVLMNMCMVCDGDKVLVQKKRSEEYPGITFPGGHVENYESFTDAVIREVREETGLTIVSPRLCGIKDWQGKEDGIRCVVFFYRTEQFAGTLKSSDEGEVFWVHMSELPRMQLAEGMSEMLEVFTKEDVGEYFFSQENGGWKGRLI